MLSSFRKNGLGYTATFECTFKVIASSVPFSEASSPVVDPWDGYPEEREEILVLLKNKKLREFFDCRIVIVLIFEKSYDLWL